MNVDSHPTSFVDTPHPISQNYDNHFVSNQKADYFPLEQKPNRILLKPNYAVVEKQSTGKFLKLLALIWKNIATKIKWQILQANATVGIDGKRSTNDIRLVTEKH